MNVHKEVGTKGEATPREDLMDFGQGRYEEFFSFLEEC